MMDRRRKGSSSTTGSSGPGWLATAGGALLLIALGFGVGIVAGTAYQEPELVVDHLAGRSTEVVLEDVGIAGSTELSVPDVAAPAPDRVPALGAGALAQRATAPAAAPTPERETAPAAKPSAAAPTPARSRGEAVSSAPAPVKPRAEVAAAPPTRAPAVTAAPARSEGFSIQVGAFSSEKAARQLASELGRSGYAAYLADEGGGARWKVRVGPLATRREAEAISAKLKREQRLPTWIQANG